MPLTLSLANLSVTLSKFLDTDSPRTLLQQPSSIEFSANGTPAVSGIAVEAKHIWNMQAVVNRNARDAMEALIWEFQYRRREQLAYDLLLEDTTGRFTERSPRTRGIIAGSSERLIGATHITYFAQFKGVFTEIPKFTLPRDCIGQNSVVSLTIVETIKVPA